MKFKSLSYYAPPPKLKVMIKIFTRPCLLYPPTNTVGECVSKAIGGVRVKKSCQANMKDLLTGEQMLFTELQNFAAFKSYCILNFGKLVGFLIKKDAKIEFSDVLRIFELLLHLKSNLAEIWNIAFIHKGKKSGVFFLKNVVNF